MVGAGTLPAAGLAQHAVVALDHVALPIPEVVNAGFGGAPHRFGGGGCGGGVGFVVVFAVFGARSRARRPVGRRGSPCRACLPRGNTLTITAGQRPCRAPPAPPGPVAPVTRVRPRAASTSRAR